MDKYLSNFKEGQIPMCRYCDRDYLQHKEESDDGHEFSFNGWVKEGNILHHDIF
jgi:hypothetical protein